MQTSPCTQQPVTKSKYRLFDLLLHFANPRNSRQVLFSFLLPFRYDSYRLPALFLRQFSVPASSTELAVKIKIEVGEGEPIESALRRFKREVNKSGHLMELRHKRYFENSQDRKKRKIVQARNRKRLERMQKRRMQQQRS
ncbi:hypothetical protein ACHAXS_008354 [Conticribra weissflogii]